VSRGGIDQRRSWHGTPVHGVQDIGEGVKECLEVGVIQGGVGIPVNVVQEVGADGGFSRDGSDPG
jgi:hypothetical protein